VLDLVSCVLAEPEIFTKRAFIVDMADDEQIGRAVLAVLERV
jgi:hypothetical protein